jgi:hypothetical protein
MLDKRASYTFMDCTFAAEVLAKVHNMAQRSVLRVGTFSHVFPGCMPSAASPLPALACTTQTEQHLGCERWCLQYMTPSSIVGMHIGVHNSCTSSNQWQQL